MSLSDATRFQAGCSPIHTKQLILPLPANEKRSMVHSFSSRGFLFEIPSDSVLFWASQFYALCPPRTLIKDDVPIPTMDYLAPCPCGDIPPSERVEGVLVGIVAARTKVMVEYLN